MIQYKDFPLLSKYDFIVGIDEVGRGSWAGPLHVGAYILTSDTKLIEGVTDSKKINPKNRTSMAEQLRNTSEYIIKSASPEEIDQAGVGKAITKLVSEIVLEVNDKYKNVLVIIDGQFALDFGRNTFKEIKADMNYYSVGAASIIAKVERDSIMKSLSSQFPNYNFASNKGYPSLEHRNALKQFGAVSLHRKSYKPVQQSLKTVR